MIGTFSGDSTMIVLFTYDPLLNPTIGSPVSDVPIVNQLLLRYPSLLFSQAINQLSKSCPTFFFSSQINLFTSLSRKNCVLQFSITLLSSAILNSTCSPQGMLCRDATTSSIFVFRTILSYYSVTSFTTFSAFFMIFSTSMYDSSLMPFINSVLSCIIFAFIRLFFANYLLKSSQLIGEENFMMKKGLFFCLHKCVASACSPKFFLKYLQHCFRSKNFSIPQKISLFAVLASCSSSDSSLPSRFMILNVICFINNNIKLYQYKKPRQLFYNKIEQQGKNMQTSDEVWREQLSLWNNSTCLVQCLGNKSTVLMIQNNSQQFSQMVLKKPSIAKQLLQIALIPEHYQLRYCQLSLDNTYNCMEVLGCLSADFTLHCTRDLLSWMLEVDVAEGTPLSNLLRILTTLLYHHPTEFIHCLADHHPQFMHTHLSDGGVVDFVLRVMEAEDEASFYSQQKVTILQRIVHTIGQMSEQFLPDVLETYAGILVGLAQKGDDRFDGSKFNDFFKLAFSTSQITDFILPLYQEYRDRELATECMQVIEAYLRFIAPESSDSLLPQQFLCDVAVVLSSKVTNRHTCLFMVFYLQSLSRLVKLDGVSLKTIITQPLLNSIMQLMPMYPSNTIIHNLVKDILISVLNKNPHYFGLMMVQEGSVLLGMLRKVTAKNSTAPMQNALYHVYNAIMLTSHTPILEVLKKSCYEEMVEKLEQKKAFYETKIGGNPRVDSDKLGSSDEFVIGGAGLEILNAWSVKQTYSDDGNKSEGEDLPLSSNQPNQLEDLQLKVDSEHSFDLKLNSVEPHSCAQQEEINKQEGSFMKHFDSYVHFDVEQLMSQMN